MGINYDIHLGLGIGILYNKLSKENKDRLIEILEDESITWDQYHFDVIVPMSFPRSPFVFIAFDRSDTLYQGLDRTPLGVVEGHEDDMYIRTNMPESMILYDDEEGYAEYFKHMEGSDKLLFLLNDPAVISGKWLVSYYT